MGIIEDRQQDVVEIKCKNCRNKCHVEAKQNENHRNSLRLVYYGCFALLAIILIVQISVCIDVYLQKPTYTESHLVPQYHAEFPALSICSSSTSFKEDILKVRI